MRSINKISNTMICRLNCIKNMNTLESLERLEQIVNVICVHNQFNVKEYIHVSHRDSEYSMMYILDDTHISIRTFPMSNSLNFHLICHKNYDHSDCRLIYNFLVEALDADRILSTVAFDDITT